MPSVQSKSTTQWKMLCVMSKLFSSAACGNRSLQCLLCLFTLVANVAQDSGGLGICISPPGSTLLAKKHMKKGLQLAPGPFIGFHSCSPRTGRLSLPQEGSALIKSSARFGKTWLFVRHHRTRCDTPGPGLKAVTAAFHNSKRKGRMACLWASEMWERQESNHE